LQKDVVYFMSSWGWTIIYSYFQNWLNEYVREYIITSGICFYGVSKLHLFLH